MSFKRITICAVTLLVTSCVSVTPLQPTAAKVVTISVAPPATCHLIKPLSVTTHNGVDTYYRSHEDIQADQWNQLRNTTASLGGNVLVLDKHETTYQEVTMVTDHGVATHVNTVNDHDADDLVHTHKMSGAAYLCDAKDLASLSAATPKNHVHTEDDAKAN